MDGATQQGGGEGKVEGRAVDRRGVGNTHQTEVAAAAAQEGVADGTGNFGLKAEFDLQRPAAEVER